MTAIVSLDEPRLLGDTAYLQVSFYNLEGARSDPTQVFLDIDPPLEELPYTKQYGADPEVTKDPTVVGRYHMALPLDLAGRWDGRWRGTGVVTSVVGWTLYVSPWPMRPSDYSLISTG